MPKRDEQLESARRWAVALEQRNAYLADKIDSAVEALSNGDEVRAVAYLVTAQHANHQPLPDPTGGTP